MSNDVISETQLHSISIMKLPAFTIELPEDRDLHQISAFSLEASFVNQAGSPKVADYTYIWVTNYIPYISSSSSPPPPSSSHHRERGFNVSLCDSQVQDAKEVSINV